MHGFSVQVSALSLILHFHLFIVCRPDGTRHRTVLKKFENCGILASLQLEFCHLNRKQVKCVTYSGMSVMYCL
jgi:hypothetical protein